MSCSKCGIWMKSWRRKYATYLTGGTTCQHVVQQARYADEIPEKGVDPTRDSTPCRVATAVHGCNFDEKKTLFGNKLQVRKEKFQQESDPKPKSRVAVRQKSQKKVAIPSVQQSLDFSRQHNTHAQLERIGDIFWFGVIKMPVRVRNNANKEAFHGKQLTAFLRRRPVTAVLLSS